ncbi:unnamed protein product [Diatraea saccharalis]|uniref:Swi5-dependent recombination DNA repair protein 1 homolog n=1 Tax=Diatraea saccharalis TaxID=40085 RepID=A0A9N9RE18_9NEOP|nr:unnamed protein product [Diatraea saccharalis]
MKTTSSMKSDKNIESPKTPGGISKSLLTPCRRVGLSRNWRKKGPSPFMSPLATNTEINPCTNDTPRKRKQLDEETTQEHNKEILFKIVEETSQTNTDINQFPQEYNEIDKTPSRNISFPKRKRSKTSIKSKIDNLITEGNTSLDTTKERKYLKEGADAENTHNQDKVVTPIRTNSESKSKEEIIDSLLENPSRCNDVKENVDINEINQQQKGLGKNSPENLTKECIVVIQKKIFKKDLDKLKKSNKKESKNKTQSNASQVLFDSDSDDVPLSILNKNSENIVETKIEPTITNLDTDDDFMENTKIKVKKLEDKTTSTGGLQNKPNVKKKLSSHKEVIKKSRKESNSTEHKPESQGSLDDDDDDFVMEKRTILIRKSYDKVTQPLKAKSTGSITQKDIDDIKARIESKKKLLLAKAMTKDTEELRGLIKKWQRGCQDALMELMELMRQKFPEKQNMDYSEILRTLKIPASMVGYDEENDIFITPTDENIIISKFNNF